MDLKLKDSSYTYVMLNGKVLPVVDGVIKVNKKDLKGVDMDIFEETNSETSENKENVEHVDKE